MIDGVETVIQWLHYTTTNKSRKQATSEENSTKCERRDFILDVKTQRLLKLITGHNHFP